MRSCCCCPERQRSGRRLFWPPVRTRQPAPRAAPRLDSLGEQGPPLRPHRARAAPRRRRPRRAPPARAVRLRPRAPADPAAARAGRARVRRRRRASRVNGSHRPWLAAPRITACWCKPTARLCLRDRSPAVRCAARCAPTVAVSGAAHTVWAPRGLRLLELPGTCLALTCSQLF